MQRGKEGADDISSVYFSFSNILWVISAIAWSSYVYVQELEKKT